MDVNYILKLLLVFVIMSLISDIFAIIFDKYNKPLLVEFFNIIFCIFIMMFIICLIFFVMAKIFGY